MKRIVPGIGVLLSLSCVFWLMFQPSRNPETEGRPVMDMAGRSVLLPEKVERITCIHSIPSHMLWRLAPEKMISIDLQFKDRMLLISEEETQRLSNLPVTGIYRRGLQREEILALAPDLILSMSKDPNLDREQEDFDTPVFSISKDRLADYAEAFRLLGALVGNESDGNMLADYWEETMARVARVVEDIPDADRPRVYYAQRNVSSTVGSETIMASIIHLAGGKSFSDELQGVLLQSENIPVSLEEVLAWDPEVIVAASGSAREEILSDPRWQHTTAVRKGRVYAVVKLTMPDRIQSLMGLVWMVNQLHPDRAGFDMLAETQRFYELMCLNGNVAPGQLQEAM